MQVKNTKWNKRLLLILAACFALCYNFLLSNLIGFSATIPILLLGILLTTGSFLIYGKPKRGYAYFILALWLASGTACFLTDSAYAQICFSILTLLYSASPFLESANLLDLINKALVKFLPGVVFESDEPAQQLDDTESLSHADKEAQKEKRFSRFTTLLLVSIVFLAFTGLYSIGIPHFGEYVTRFFDFVWSFVPDISFSTILRLIIGFALGLYAWRMIKVQNQYNWENEALTEDSDKSSIFNLEVSRGTILLAVLIPLLGAALLFEVKFLWFSSGPIAEYNELQRAVRTGTAGLIASVVFSLFIALYIFKGDLNFDTSRSGRRLKVLTYIWLGMNLLMSLAIMVRTGIYIENYNMAYKRFGVLIFCVAACYALILIVIKVRYKRNGLFYIRHLLNGSAILLVLFSFINYDRIILRYNINHPEAFMDLDYLYSRNLDAVLSFAIQDEYLDKKIKGWPNHHWLEKEYGKISYAELVRKRVAEWQANMESADWRNYSRRNSKIGDMIQKESVQRILNPPYRSPQLQEHDHKLSK